MSAVPPRNAPPRSKLPLYLGTAVAATAGYYYFSAGRNTKDAKLKAEADFNKATGRGPGASERTLEKAGSEIDRTIDTGRQKYDAAKDALKEESARVNNKIDEVDRTVENKAADAKAKAKGWFGA